MKLWIARTILLVGYTSVVTFIAMLIYHYVYIIGPLIGIFISVLLGWIGLVWICHVFAWAHKHWRKEL